MIARVEEDQIPSLVGSSGLIDQMPCGLVYFNLEGKIYGANRTLSGWVGREVCEMQQQGFKSLLSRASLLYYNLMLEPMLSLKSEVSEINLQLIGPSGPMEVLFNAVSYRDKQDKVVLVQATLQRITNRKNYELELMLEKRLAEEQQRKLEFVFNLSPMQIYTADRDGNVLSINQQVVEYFGGMELEDASSFSGVYAPDREKAAYEREKSIRSGKGYEMNVRFLGTIGKPEWFFVKVEPFLNPAGEIDMWLCCSMNINKQKLAQLADQKELARSLSSAHESLDNNAKRFSAIAISQSHMVRKPVANIIALMGLIKDEADEAQLDELMGLMGQSVEELEQMIKKITNEIGR